MKNDGYLTCKDIMNYAYCKRIPYFEHIIKIPQRTTKKEIAGRKKHVEFERKTRRNMRYGQTFRKYRAEHNVFLSDDEHGFKTIIDCILITFDNKEAIVLQVKNSTAPRIIYKSQRMQLYAEGYLVKRKLGFSVTKAWIKYLKDGSLREFSISERTDSEFLEELKEIKKMIMNEIIPEPTEYKKKCKDCCFREICGRV